jgi:hypothetical protein
MRPPFAAPASRPVQSSHETADKLPSIQEFLDELPSIEDFLDHSAVLLPPIENFVAEEEQSVESENVGASSDWFEHEPEEDGWAPAGWQDFDWASASSLNASSEGADEANSAWDTMDWPGPEELNAPVGEAEVSSRSADEVANALDAIAQRIRSGELEIDQLSGTPPEAAMAAALAAMLRMRS